MDERSGFGWGVFAPTDIKSVLLDMKSGIIRVQKQEEVMQMKYR
jgi:hypothetical protein